MPKPISVLILDDDKELLSSIERLFASEPYGIFTTTHPFEALGVLSREAIKVVVSDQRMPMVSGSNFLKEVKENFPHTVRILFTGHADMRAAEEAVNKGQVFAFFSKPCDPDALLAAIRKGIEIYYRAEEDRRILEFLKMSLPELRQALSEAKADLEAIKADAAGTLSADQLDRISRVSERLEKLGTFFQGI